MTQQEFSEQIRRLSIKDRIALIEAISRSLREDLEPSVPSAPSESIQTEAQDPARDEPLISRRLYGILKFDGDPPTDEEVKDAYADYLLEKYS